MYTFKKKIEIAYFLIDLNKIFLMKPSEINISISVESYNEKTVIKKSAHVLVSTCEYTFLIGIFGRLS